MSTVSRPRRSAEHANVWVWVIAGGQLALLLATSTRYGYHRDELYFIVAGGHPAFGYPDQPPLVPLLCRAMNLLAPGSLLILRAPSALIAAATTLVATLIAREVGGSRRAQVIAAACTAVSGFALAVAHLVSTTTPDLLGTTLLGWLVVRAVVRRSPVTLLVAGIVVGIGIQSKPQIGLVAVVMAAAVFFLGPRAMLRSRWAVGGMLVAVALAAPYVIWQQQHGWPQLTVAKHIAGSQEGGRAGFVPFQLVMVAPLLVPVWVAGLAAPFRRPRWRQLRFVPVTYLAMAVLYLVGDGHAYYLASLYPLLLGLGAIPTAEWTERAPYRTPALVAAIILSGAISAIIALPLLPERDLEGSVTIALNSAQGETVGWPTFVRTVARAWQAIPAPERSRATIFTANYGEAGAIDVLGAKLGLPAPYSAHNGFSEWAKPPDQDTRVLLLGFDNAAEAAPQFTRCRTVARVENGVGLDNQEQGLPLMFCRISRSWRALWPSLTHYD